VIALVAALNASNQARTDTVLSVPVFALWALALFLGAGLFAGERSRQTSAFQFERPVARETIWNAKLLMPAVALAMGELLFLLVTAWLCPPHYLESVALIVFVLTALLCFASAVLCSVLLPRPVTAWAAGGVLCVALGGGGGLLIDRLFGLWGTSNNPGPWLLFLGLFILEAIVLLWLSRVAYVRWMHD